MKNIIPKPSMVVYSGGRFCFIKMTPSKFHKEQIKNFEKKVILYKNDECDEDFRIFSEIPIKRLVLVTENLDELSDAGLVVLLGLFQIQGSSKDPVFWESIISAARIAISVINTPLQQQAYEGVWVLKYLIDQKKDIWATLSKKVRSKKIHNRYSSIAKKLKEF